MGKNYPAKSWPPSPFDANKLSQETQFWLKTRFWPGFDSFFFGFHLMSLLVGCSLLESAHGARALSKKNVLQKRAAEYERHQVKNKKPESKTLFSIKRRAGGHSAAAALAFHGGPRRAFDCNQWQLNTIDCNSNAIASKSSQLHWLDVILIERDCICAI